MTAASTHPSPLRHRTSIWLLAFCMGGAPLFWFVQFMLGYLLADLGCFRGDAPYPTPWAHALGTAFVWFDLLAIAVALAAGFLSYVTWRSVRSEMKGQHRQTLEIGEGRSRFLAMWGMLSSGVFLIAIIFNTIATGVVPTCAN